MVKTRGFILSSRIRILRSSKVVSLTVSTNKIPERRRFTCVKNRYRVRNSKNLRENRGMDCIGMGIPTDRYDRPGAERFR